jgi:alpha-L-fucosidase
MNLQNSGSVVRKLIENVSRNGNYMLNISPKSDGTIPDEQKAILLGVGKWLDVNGDGIYCTRAWTKFGEGQVRFTKKANTLYAINLQWPAQPVTITSVTPAMGKVKKVTLLGHKGELSFTQTEQGLKVVFPQNKPCEFAYTLKIEGLNIN